MRRLTKAGQVLSRRCSCAKNKSCSEPAPGPFNPTPRFRRYSPNTFVGSGCHPHGLEHESDSRPSWHAMLLAYLEGWSSFLITTASPLTRFLLIWVLPFLFFVIFSRPPTLSLHPFSEGSSFTLRQFRRTRVNKCRLSGMLWDIFRVSNKVAPHGAKNYV